MGGVPRHTTCKNMSDAVVMSGDLCKNAGKLIGFLHLFLWSILAEFRKGH